MLRGHPALVFPLRDKHVNLRYEAAPHPLRTSCSGTLGEPLLQCFKTTLDQALARWNRSLAAYTGTLHLDANLPLGMGMGASAAICMLVARFCVAEGLLPRDEQFIFARTLEDRFHGRSSGLDLMGVSSEHGVCFVQGTATKIEQTWSPKWTVSCCGTQGLTSECIDKVQKIWTHDPCRAQQIDQQMSDCVQAAQAALVMTGDNARSQLADAMNGAADCFAQWGLITEALAEHMQQKREQGAIAVKPTGSGGGGCVVSLWP